MDACVISSETHEANISVNKADIGILYLVQHELLKAQSVDFAGVIMKHPLTGECWMRVNSKTSPMSEIKKAVAAAAKTADDLKDLFNSKIRVD